MELDPQCIINNSFLPQYMIKHRDKYNVINSLCKKQLSSNNWSMIAQIGNKSPEFEETVQSNCYLTIFHCNLLSSSSISNTCNAYNIELPSFPINNMVKVPSTVFNKTDNILYGMNSKCIYYYHPGTGGIIEYNADPGKSIYSLDFKEENKNKWKWNLKHSNLSISRYNTSVCMVDNDRFISILGGCDNSGNLNIAELFALNCNTSINLNKMNRKRNNAISLYHDKMHKIIIGGQWFYDGIEAYDINKDQWMMIMDSLCFSDVKNMFISKKNPNILFLVGTDYKQKYELHKIDLRCNNDKNDTLIEHQPSQMQGLCVDDLCVMRL